MSPALQEPRPHRHQPVASRLPELQCGTSTGHLVPMGSTYPTGSMAQEAHSTPLSCRTRTTTGYMNITTNAKVFHFWERWNFSFQAHLLKYWLTSLEDENKNLGGFFRYKNYPKGKHCIKDKHNQTSAFSWLWCEGLSILLGLGQVFPIETGLHEGGCGKGRWGRSVSKHKLLSVLVPSVKWFSVDSRGGCKQ